MRGSWHAFTVNLTDLGQKCLENFPTVTGYARIENVHDLGSFKNLSTDIDISCISDFVLV